MVGFGLELMCKISQKKIGEGKKDHDTNTTQGGIKNPLGSIDFWSQILENAVLPLRDLAEKKKKIGYCN